MPNTWYTKWTKMFLLILIQIGYIKSHKTWTFLIDFKRFLCLIELLIANNHTGH